MPLLPRGTEPDYNRVRAGEPGAVARVPPCQLSSLSDEIAVPDVAPTARPEPARFHTSGHARPDARYRYAARWTLPRQDRAHDRWPAAAGWNRVVAGRKNTSRYPHARNRRSAAERPDRRAPARFASSVLTTEAQAEPGLL